MSQSRQLAAIMFTDIVGYTSLMGKDEQKAFDLLNKNRQIQKPIIEEFNGIWIKELGDGVMASFKTVSDAVNAAIKIQKACNTAKEFQLRIGIHQGEVVIEDKDMFGDAVNIASRIQSIALPGSIFISEVVYHNVSNKNDIQTHFVSTERLKNVKEPIKVYRINTQSSEEKTKKRQSSYKTLWHSKKKIGVTAVVGLILLLGAGYFIFGYLQKGKSDNATVTPDKSIAVLPFVNMSNDPQQEYFSDGLSEELLNMLAKIPELKVIGRTSSFSFKGKNEDLRIIAQKLGVAHLLEGSVRKDGNKIRVTAQLIRASDGSHLWSETYDRDLAGIFKLQDEIAQAVIQELSSKLFVSGGTEILLHSNAEAYNLTLQGNFFYDKLDEENVAKSVQYYQRALSLDSTDAWIWAKLGNSKTRQAWQNYIDQHAGYENARLTALKAISLNKNLAEGYEVLGDIKLYHDFDWKGAKETYQIGVNLEPGNADLVNSMGDALDGMGLEKEAEQYYRKSILLDPLKPIVHMNLGNCLTYQGRYEEAIASFKKALEINPQFQRAHLYQGRNYILMGKPEEALKEMLLENMEMFKDFGLAMVYHALHRDEEADTELKKFKEKHQNDWPYLIAQLHAFRGEKDAAFSWLEIAYDKRDSWLFWVKGDPLLSNLTADPRYNAFLRKMNLKPD